MTEKKDGRRHTDDIIWGMNEKLTKVCTKVDVQEKSTDEQWKKLDDHTEEIGKLHGKVGKIWLILGLAGTIIGGGIALAWAKLIKLFGNGS